MTMESLIKSLKDQIGSDSDARRSRIPWLSPQSVFVYLEETTDHQTSALLYANPASHAAAIRRHYPFYVKWCLKGTPQNMLDTEALFNSHGVEFNDGVYEAVAAAILAEINRLTDDELSVLRF